MLHVFVSCAISCVCQRVYSVSGWFGSAFEAVVRPRFLSTDTGVSFLESHEALVGVRVRVLETDRRPQLRGMLGTIEHRFGHPEYVALDVRLDDGQLELFWAHGLENAE